MNFTDFENILIDMLEGLYERDGGTTLKMRDEFVRNIIALRMAHRKAPEYRLAVYEKERHFAVIRAKWTEPLETQVDGASLLCDSLDLMRLGILELPE